VLLDRRPAYPAYPQGDRRHPSDAWTKIKYANAVWDEQTQAWISDAEVA